jgi:hypothetical protein
MQLQAPSSDLYRRFAPIPLAAELNVMGRRILLETNSPTVLRHTRRAFQRYEELPAGPRQFHWKLISDPSSDLQPPLSRRVGFSDEGIRFINLNQRAFLAIDLLQQEAIGFLPEGLANDEMSFLSPFLSDLFDMTSAAMSLTEMMCGCVALEGCGLLIFGPARSGKSTSGYLAGKLGMEFHADQVTCLEVVNGSLRAWGQFWPPAFRPETLEFLPELETRTRPFHYRDFSLLCLDKNPHRPERSAGVMPTACVFLERLAADTVQVVPVSKSELSLRLARSLPFKEDRCFDDQRAEIVRRLSELPAYRLLYPADPRAAAEMFPELLKRARDGAILESGPGGVEARGN